MAGALEADSFVPWDELSNNSWINGALPQRMHINTVNNGSYEIGFDLKRTDDGARGMNALKFSVDGQNTGHHISSSTDGSFTVENTGGSRTFDDLLVLVVIDAISLRTDFSFALATDCNGVDCNDIYYFDNALDFTFYDPYLLGYDTGRPSGYYSLTSPSSEPVSYLSNSGIVTVFAFVDVRLRPSIYPDNKVKINYHFTHLNGEAVFSVYGFDQQYGWIYHTNRALLDENDPYSEISTFAVIPIRPTADFDDDYDVDLLDLRYFAEYWMCTGCDDPNNPCHIVDLDATGQVDLLDFADYTEQYLNELYK